MELEKSSTYSAIACLKFKKNSILMAEYNTGHHINAILASLLFSTFNTFSLLFSTRV